MARNDPLFDDLEDGIDIEGDNLEHIVGGFGDYLRLNAGKYLSPSSKAKLFEHVQRHSLVQ
jgi:hypothetical protein